MEPRKRRADEGNLGRELMDFVALLPIVKNTNED
ncbi:hypothetical protein CCACVL1_14746, partial [Corchorus capsularis]